MAKKVRCVLDAMIPVGGTLEMLLTSQVSITEVVIIKFFIT